MLLIRADGNAKIGAGHLMRCLTIAEEYAGLWEQEEVCFVCADTASADLAAEHGFRTCVLGTDYREMESELSVWEDKLKRALPGISEKPVVLVDSYFVTDKYLYALRNKGRIVLLEDLGERRYPVDCVINYNAYADREQYESMYQGQDVKLIIGSRYIPLRRQFLDIRHQVRDKAQTVLITTGGGDKDNIAGKILDRLYSEDLIFCVVTGRFNPNLPELNRQADRYENVHIRYDVKDMAELMATCDVAVTAGGSTIYELAAVGVPFVCFSYAKNQEPLTQYIGSDRIAYEAGAWHKDPAGTLSRLGEQFDELAESSKRRAVISKRLKDLADGQGAARLAAELKELS